MRKVVLYIAVSLDGYVADKDGKVEFLQGDGSDAENPGTYEEFYANVGDVIMGYTTYHQVTTELMPGTYAYAGKKSYVFTSKKIENTEDVVFVNRNVAEFIAELKENNDEGDIWINGGASIVNQVIWAGLVDEIIISTIPTILGGGIRLFAENEKEVKLKYVSSSVANGIVETTYILR